MPERLTHEDFANQLNSKFCLPLEGREPVELELCEVSALKSLPRQEIFSIVFRGPIELMLPQRIYSLEHDVLNSVDLFLVPVRKDDAGIYYEAVFNRLVK